MAEAWQALRPVVQHYDLIALDFRRRCRSVLRVSLSAAESMRVCVVGARADDVGQGTETVASPEQSVVPAVQTW